jgi:glycine cleavage system H protein
VNVPDGLHYTPTHEWVRMEGDIATIGITDYAQSELGDIVFVEVPTPGRVLAKGEGLTTVESVKTVSDVYAPAACEVVESNPALGTQAELLNTDPYGEGWIAKVRFTEGEPALLGAGEYAASIG